MPAVRLKRAHHLSKSNRANSFDSVTDDEFSEAGKEHKPKSSKCKYFLTGFCLLNFALLGACIVLLVQAKIEIAVLENRLQPDYDTGDADVKSLESSSNGLKGAKGEKGAIGPMGISGTNGIPGLHGSDGAVGPKGEKGTKGLVGSKGDIGIPGFKGDKGDVGIKGDIGLQGDKGEKGDTGVPGMNGTKGEVGKAASKGDKGETGEKGSKGENGLDGMKGDVGLVGPSGKDGVNGSKGDTGPKGEKGESGLDGVNGTKGEPGFKGERGENGTRGDIGLPGQNGTEGIKGEPGLKGEPGEIPNIEELEQTVDQILAAVKEARGNQVRLANGDTNFGRVELYHNGVWGTVCDDAWSIEDATVICKMLGFATATDAPRRGNYGEGAGPIWLDQVECTGTEFDIENCAKSAWGDHDCGHDEDAGVICS